MTDTIQKIADDMQNWRSLPAWQVDQLHERLRALSARASAGEGGEWVLVPRLPTPGMLDAGLLGLSHSGVDNACEADARNAYQYMLAATPPAHGDGEGDDPFGDMPAPIGNPEAWPPNYADGYNDAVRNMVDSFPSVRARLTTRPTPEAQEARDSCVWTFDDDDRAPMWNSACGEAWSFTEGGPEDNSYRYCHGCGKPIAALALPAQGEG